MFDIKSEYYFIPWPYISKTVFTGFKKCKYYHKRVCLEGFTIESNRVMVEGTTLHYTYYKFFELVNFDMLFEMDWRANHDTIYSQVYNYFYSVMMTQLPEDFDNKKMIRGVKSFCHLEENHWYSVREKYAERGKILRYFKPGVKQLEIFMRNDDIRIFGTIDRISVEPEKTVIIDYKTGNVSQKVSSEIRETVYSKDLPAYYVPEGNFYVLLYLLNMGYTVGKDENDKWNIYKNGKECNKIIKKMDYAFVFTGEKVNKFPSYYICRKKSSIVSIRSVLKTLPKMRACKEFPRNPNIMRCKYCQLFAKDCKDVVPFEIFGNIFRSKSPSSEGLQQLARSKN